MKRYDGLWSEKRTQESRTWRGELAHFRLDTRIAGLEGRVASFSSGHKNRGLGGARRRVGSFSCGARHGTYGFVLLTLLIVSFTANAYAASFSEGPCHNLAVVTGPGKKRIVNLDELTEMSRVKPFAYVDVANDWTYEFAICANSVRCGDEMAASCQSTEQFGGSYYPLGVYSFPPMALYNPGYIHGAITFILPPMNHRGSIITIVCDPLAHIPTNITASSPSPNLPAPFMYQMSLTHKSACGDYWLHSPPNVTCAHAHAIQL